jgi:hypothetical protein
MALIDIGGYVMDTHTAAELLRIIGRVPQNKRASFLDGLKDPDYYKGIEAEEQPLKDEGGARNG